MKSAGAIKHKLNQVRFRYLKKRLESELRQAPANCRYNATPPAHTHLDGKGQQVEHPALCLYGAENPTTWTPSYCDDRLDQGARARSCSLFCAKRSKDEIKVEFHGELDRLAFPEVAFHYPDMAALIWVLDAEDLVTPDEVPPVEAPVVEQTPEAAPVHEDLRNLSPVEVATYVRALDAPVPEAHVWAVAPDVSLNPPTVVVVEDVPTPQPPKKPWYARLLGDA